MLLICYRNIRMSHWLAGLVLLRQVIEILAVGVHIWFWGGKALKEFRSGKLQATKCMPTLKKVLPQLVRLWGYLSNYHVHPTKEILGASLIDEDPKTGWGKIFIGSTFHIDKLKEVEKAIIHVLLVSYYLNAATELIFWQFIKTPKFWQPVNKSGNKTFGKCGPVKDNENFEIALFDRIKKISSPFYGFEDRIKEEDLINYQSLIENGGLKGPDDRKGLRKIIKKNQKNYFFIYLLANAYRNSDDIKKALSLYNYITKKSDKLYDSYHFMGLLYSNIGENSKAVNSYEAHVQHYPDAYMTLNNLGLLYDKIGKFDKAIKAYQKAQKIYEKYYKAIYNEANALKHKGEFEAAIAKYKEAISINYDPGAYHNMGLAYMELKKINSAYKAYRKAVIIDPGYFPSWFNLGATSMYEGNLKKAYLCYLKCVDLIPDSLESALMLAQISLELSNIDDAKRWADTIQKINPECHLSEEIYQQIKLSP